MKVTYTRPVFKAKGKTPRVLIISRKKLNIIASCLVVGLTLAFCIYSFQSKKSPKAPEQMPQNESKHQDIVVSKPPESAPKKEEPEQWPIMDLSEEAIKLDSNMQRINEPTPFGKEILYSAGNTATINEPVFKELYMWNIDTGEENIVAETDIKFGEIYEARFNKDWVVWLDTNQSGTNDIYVLKRDTGEITKINSCEYNKPRLRLDNDNLVWVEQQDTEEDRLYLYNFKSGEPISLESFDNPTYGTSPPAIGNDILVWAYPNEKGPDNSSVIKKLDLSKALSILQVDVDEEVSHAPEEDAVEPDIIDTQGFAIYPMTNGKAIAWLDHIDPSQANLKITVDEGHTIINIAKGVARIYGIGDEFIAYMQNEAIMVYFWDSNRYAQLTKPEYKGRLSTVGVHGNMVVWYCADDPNKDKDQVMFNIINPPSKE